MNNVPEVNASNKTYNGNRDCCLETNKSVLIMNLNNNNNKKKN